MGLILTREELRELTGSQQRAQQRSHLDAMGIPYRVNAYGWPVVLRQAAIETLGGRAANDDRQQEATVNLEGLV